MDRLRYSKDVRTLRNMLINQASRYTEADIWYALTDAQRVELAQYKKDLRAWPSLELAQSDEVLTADDYTSLQPDAPQFIKDGWMP